MSGGTGQDFDARRADARQAATRRLQSLTEDDDGQGWFEDVYKAAAGDPARVMWADLEPHPGLAEWIGRSGNLYEGRALDVGCGLGDNAEALGQLGYEVTAFDLSPTAVAWARQRFEGSPVTYVAADLFDAPEEWEGAFDLVHETYTLQALMPGKGLREKAMAQLARFVKPGGRLLVIARARPEDEVPDGPPWPLDRFEFEGFEKAGLEVKNFQKFILREDGEIPHFRVDYVRPQ
ncbi:MAG: class I SAM-dependent methyltransferase [Pseudomonadota bacterium]